MDHFRFLNLALHPEKTKFILFSNSPEARASNFNIFLNFNNDNDAQNDDLISYLVRITADSEVPAIKFLGIYIDPSLNFKFHIDNIISKISKSLYFFRSAKNFLSQKALKSIYFALIHSHLIYGIQVWSCANQHNLNAIFLKQKNAIRILNSAKYNAHTEPLFKSCGILPLHSLIEFFQIQFFHNFIIGDLPTSFFNYWIRNEDRRPAGAILRNNQEFHIPHTRLSTTDRFPRQSFPRLWNSCENEDIKSIANKNSFNLNLKNYFLNKLNPNYVCARLLCPHCHIST